MSNGVTPKSVEALGRRHLMLFGGRASRELAAQDFGAGRIRSRTVGSYRVAGFVVFGRYGSVCTPKDWATSRS